MDCNEMAKIVAMLRIMGSKMSAKEIIESYQSAYTNALTEIQETSQPAKVTFTKRQF